MCGMYDSFKVSLACALHTKEVLMVFKCTNRNY